MTNQKLLVGWREWARLPELNIEQVKVKVDTGARTSALHAYFIEPFVDAGVRMVRFGVHPLQKNVTFSVVCECPVKDFRQVTDSGGHREMRYVIETPVKLGDQIWPIEVTLTNRSKMSFRMLLGRSALKNIAVLPDRSFLCGRLDRNRK